MSWTDERVERLRQLWTEGRSASQIATEIGNGVTRNAVIGKVHRLGMSGRAKDQAPATAKPRPVKPIVERSAPMSHSAPMTRGATALAYAPIHEPILAPRAVRQDVVVPMTTRVSIMELREAMCRWPLGDPSTQEFRYCGCRSPIGAPYCADHSRLAYQPTQDRRRAPRPQPIG